MESWGFCNEYIYLYLEVAHQEQWNSKYIIHTKTYPVLAKFVNNTQEFRMIVDSGSSNLGSGNKSRGYKVYPNTSEWQAPVPNKKIMNNGVTHEPRHSHSEAFF